jgi:predicted enzyme related to lactoylglutathione lyase
MGRIIHALVAIDHERAAGFYREVFGGRVTPAAMPDGYLLAETGAGEGIDGAIMSNRHQSQPTIAWIEVDDLDTTLVAVRDAGGAPVGDVHELRGVGCLACVRDTEGVLVGLRQT